MGGIWLNVGHLADTFIVDNFNDMSAFKSLAHANNLAVPHMIVASFDCPEYQEAYDIGLVDMPNVVANMSMDHKIDVGMLIVLYFY